MWLFPHRNFQMGDAVLVTTDLGSKDDWPLSRSSAIHLGADGLLRKVDVITSKGKVQRDVSKVSSLEDFADDNSQDSDA